MAFSLEEYKQWKDYVPGSFDKCLVCNYFINWSCSGPNLANMESKRRTVFCKAVRAVRGFTNQYIADQSGVSFATVERFFSGIDLNMNSFTSISRVLFGLSNEHPCGLTIEDDSKAMLDALQKAENENEMLRNTLENIHTSYKDEIRDIRKSYEKVLADIQDNISSTLEHYKEEIIRQQKIIDKLL